MNITQTILTVHLSFPQKLTREQFDAVQNAADEYLLTNHGFETFRIEIYKMVDYNLRFFFHREDDKMITIDEAKYIIQHLLDKAGISN